MGMLLFAVILSAATVAVAGEPSEQKPTTRMTVTLVDGSRLVGTPGMDAIRIQTSLGMLAIGLDRIREIVAQRKEGTTLLRFQNGDQLTGTLQGDSLPLHCIFGKAAPRWDQIEKAGITLTGGKMLPPGEGPLEFGGVRWMPWRTMFEVRDDRLVSLPKVRPGFNYGHGGHGRGPIVATNIGNDEWRDYRIDCEVGVGRADPSWNPHGLSPAFPERSVVIHFHVADLKESWNDTGTSTYSLLLGTNGKWSLGCCYNWHVPGICGFRSVTSDGARELATGEGIKLDEKNGNHVRIDVVGNRIQAWLDNQPLADVVDSKMTDEVGGQRLDHGGVAFEWTWECMGWIRNFSATKL